MHRWLTTLALVVVSCNTTPLPHSEPLAMQLHRNPLIGDLPLQQLTECPGYDPSLRVGADVAVVIDNSPSTRDATGLDINLNGAVGKTKLRFAQNRLLVGSSDPGDSYLSAQIAGLRSLLHGTDASQNRFAIAAFGGSADTSLLVSPL